MRTKSTLFTFFIISIFSLFTQWVQWKLSKYSYSPLTKEGRSSLALAIGTWYSESANPIKCW